MSGTSWRLVLHGELDPRFAYLFDGMTMDRVDGTTVLTGDLVDRAMLFGYLERIGELGLELIELQQLERCSRA